MYNNLDSRCLIAMAPNSANSAAENSEATLAEASLSQQVQTVLETIEMGEFSMPMLTYGGVAILGIWAATALIKALTDLVKACQD